MANIEMWCCDVALAVSVIEPGYERRIVIGTAAINHYGSLRLTVAEAVQLRDDLSRAITEAATAAAKAVA